MLKIHIKHVLKICTLKFANKNTPSRNGHSGANKHKPKNINPKMFYLTIVYSSIRTARDNTMIHAEDVRDSRRVKTEVKNISEIALPVINDDNLSEVESDYYIERKGYFYPIFRWNTHDGHYVRRTTDQMSGRESVSNINSDVKEGINFWFMP